MKIPPLFIIILLVGTFLAGQEIKKLPRPWENKTQATESVTLEFWTLQLRDFKPLIEDWIEDYEASHSNIHIKWVDVPFSEGEKRALSAMMSPNVPDVINLNPAFASTLAERNALTPIPQALLDADPYAPALLDITRAGDKTVSFPWYTTTKLTFVNNALEDLKVGQYESFPLLTSGGNALKAIQQLEGNPFKNEASFNAAIELVLKDMKESIAKNATPREVITGSYSDALTMYMSGRLHMLEAGTSALKQIQLNAPDVYKATTISNHPNPPDPPMAGAYPLLLERRAGNKTTLDASPMVLVVPKKSKHPQEALAFARYITSTKNQLRFLDEAPVLPSTTAGLNTLMNQRKTGKTLDEKALYMSAQKVLTADKGLTTYPNQSMVNDLSNAMAQAYYLNDEARFKDYRQRLWEALPKNLK